MIKPDWINKVRLELNDLPDEYISDESIVQVLTKAVVFVDSVKRDDIDEVLYDQAVVSLAAYFAYVNYTSVVARRLGSIPEYSEERANQLKSIALAFVNKVAKTPIDEDFGLYVVDGVSPIAFTTAGIL